LDFPFAGILGSIGYTYPGLIFITIGGSYTIGAGAEFTSNNTRVSGFGNLGFWLPFVIPSVSVNYKEFYKDTDKTTDSLLRFQLGLDFYTKNFPATLRIDAGYQMYNRQRSNTDNSLHSIFAGFEANWQVMRPARLIAGVEMPVYSFIESGTVRTPDTWRLFKANIGCVYTFF
jgi:hypothetical protein